MKRFSQILSVSGRENVNRLRRVAAKVLVAGVFGTFLATSASAQYGGGFSESNKLGKPTPKMSMQEQLMLTQKPVGKLVPYTRPKLSGYKLKEGGVKICAKAGIPVPNAKVGGCFKVGYGNDGVTAGFSGTGNIGKFKFGHSGVGISHTVATPSGGYTVSGVYHPDTKEITASGGAAWGAKAGGVGAAATAGPYVTFQPTYHQQAPTSSLAEQAESLKQWNELKEAHRIDQMTPEQLLDEVYQNAIQKQSNRPQTLLEAAQEFAYNKKPVTSAPVGHVTYDDSAYKAKHTVTKPVQLPSLPKRVPGSQSSSASIRF